MSANIKFDPRDSESMAQLMQEYGGSDTMYFGENEIGEGITISIFRDRIVTATYQNDNKVRKNVYFADGTSEEFFETDAPEITVAERSREIMRGWREMKKKHRGARQ